MHIENRGCLCDSSDVNNGIIHYSLTKVPLLRLRDSDCSLKRMPYFQKVCSHLKPAITMKATAITFTLCLNTK